jgi:hypothetical protein
LRITIELPDDLHRQAKAEAALRGRTLKDMVEEGLRLVLTELRHGRRKPGQPTLPDLMKDGVGILDSGVPDLATDPKHMASYGKRSRLSGRSTRR